MGRGVPFQFSTPKCSDNPGEVVAYLLKCVAIGDVLPRMAPPFPSCGRGGVLLV